MRIGELAGRAGCTPKAVRLYESKGLLGVVERAGAFRRYGEQDLARVQLIRLAQTLGFRLGELGSLALLPTATGWERVAALVASRRHAVALERQRLADLDRQLRGLEMELASCAEVTFAATALPGACSALPPPAPRSEHAVPESA